MSKQLGNFSETTRARFDTSLKKQLTDLQKLGINVTTSVVVGEMRKVVGDTMSLVLDTTQDVVYREKTMDELISWLYSYFDAKTDENASGMLFMWSLLVGKYWTGSMLMLMEKKNKDLFGNSGLPALEVLNDMARRFFDKIILPNGRLVVSKAFDQRMYVSEFTALVQQMVMQAPMGDRRDNGSDNEVFEEDGSK